jgi:hypothetical protein
MQFGLLVALGVIRAAIGEFHDPLVADPDPLAAVVAGVAALGGDAGVADLAHADPGCATGLQAVHQQVAPLGLVDGGIPAFVEPLVAVGHMACRAARAPVVAASLAPAHAHVAALTLLA